MSIIPHTENRQRLLEAITKASEAKTILDEVRNGKSRYFVRADRAYAHLQEAVNILTVALSYEPK